MKRYLDDLAAILMLVLLVGVVLFLLGPVVITMAMSLDARKYLGPFPPPDLSLQWYKKFFSEPYILKGLRSSLLVATFATLVSAAIGVVTAEAMHRYDFPGKNILAALFLGPLIVPAVVIGFALLLYLSRVGIQNGLVRLAAGHIIITVPYAIRTTLASTIGISKSLREAALGLGATEWQAFWDVTFPLARTGIVAGMVFAFAISMDDVAVSLFLTDSTNYTLPVALISMMRANFDLTIAAGAALMMGVTIIVILGLESLFGLDRLVGTGIYRS